MEEPIRIEWEGIRLHVDTLHEILVNKLCALLSRSEIRDLQDVRALLAKGCDLSRALADAPRKDGGFSPLTLTWVLRGLPVRSLSETVNLSAEQATELQGFRDELIRRILLLASPA
jgi:hypothetical protein